MKIKPARDDHSTYTRYIDIEDGPDVRHPNSSTGKKFTVTYAKIEYRHIGRGVWDISSSYAVTLTGPVRKKNGEHGLETYNGAPPYGWNRAHKDYQWLRDLVLELQPTGTPSAPVIR